MLGTVKVDNAIIKDSAGRIIMSTKAGDKVEGDGSGTITKLTRSGVVKFTGSGYLNWSLYVDAGTVTPPSDPPPADPPPTTSTITATLTDDETGEVWSGILTKL